MFLKHLRFLEFQSSQTKHNSPVTFRLRYRWSDCGGYITPDMLPYTLTSPGSPEAYPPNSDCAWRVQTEPGQTIKVREPETNRRAPFKVKINWRLNGRITHMIGRWVEPVPVCASL